ncbi:GTPase-activating protein CdGAPr [Zerene cesonia]|uniref:GTPase-activating protein CdGAPr n=1 Tax=Zerene cesonia TaxID=33412 RepID=UPI0018E58B65|nr:GTPase-activating protein CdGAPr [Zerene cesonia]
MFSSEYRLLSGVLKKLLYGVLMCEIKCIGDMRRMFGACSDGWLLCGQNGSPHGSVMSCQSLAARAFETEKDSRCSTSFHRSVRFSSESRSTRKSNDTECKRETPGTMSLTALSITPVTPGSAMSQSAPHACAFDFDESPAPPPACRFPKLEECAHFHYERVSLGGLSVELVPCEAVEGSPQEGWVCLKVRSHVNSSDDSTDSKTLSASWTEASDVREWTLTRNMENFLHLDEMLHRCIYDRKVSGLPNLKEAMTPELVQDEVEYRQLISDYVHHLSIIADDSINCGPALNWLQMDNKGHKLLVSNEDSSSINTPAVAAAYSVRKYVSQARDEISFEVGDMISIIDMPGPQESTWWRGKRGFRVGFFPHHCVAVIGDKVPRHMTQPPPIVGSVAVAPIKPVLRKHGKLISLFRSFILSRPSRRSLKQQGILRERVFGCDLGEHLLNCGHDVFQAVVTEFLICYAEELFAQEQGAGCDDSDQERNECQVELRGLEAGRRPKSLPLNPPTKLLSLEEARRRGKVCVGSEIMDYPPPSGAIAAAATTQLKPAAHLKPKYIEVGSGPNNLPQYHTVLDLPVPGAKRALKRSVSGWRGLFSRSKLQRPRPPPATPPPAEVAVHPLRPAKSCESLASDSDTLAPLVASAAPLKHHTRSSSCDSYFEPWQAELAGMRLRLSPQERDRHMFSEEDDAPPALDDSLCSSPVESNPCSAEPSPRHNHRAEVHPTDTLERKRGSLQQAAALERLERLERQLGYIDEAAASPPPEKRAACAASRAKRVCKDRDSPLASAADFPGALASVKLRDRNSPRKQKNAARYSGLHNPVLGDPDKPVTRLTWHGKDGHSTLIKIDWPPDSSNGNLTAGTHTSSNDTPTNERDSVYEDVDLEKNLSIVEDATVPLTDASLPTQQACQPDFTEDLIILETPTETNLDDDVDVYSQVKFFKKSIEEVNAMILESPERDDYENVAFEPCRDYANVDVGTLGLCDRLDAGGAKEIDSIEHENGNVVKPIVASKNLNVRELAIRFESPTELKGPFTFEKFRGDVKYANIDARDDEKRHVKPPPPVSPKTYKLSKNSCNARSLDENAFIKEFGADKDRRKSLDVKDAKRTAKFLPDLNLNTEIPEPKLDSITPTTENKISLVQRFDVKPDIKSLIGFDAEKKLSRERIEKYKEERRNFLREKYSSQSFRSNPEQLTRIKLRKEENRVENERLSEGKFERRNTVDLGQRMRFSLARSANNLDTIPSPLSPVKDFNGEASRSRDDRKEKSSPSYNIRDMAAIFEQKSQSNSNAG